ncbi:GGDEF domain-containing protein [Alteromonas halophila]|uniref:diguanylate cyclase n=1 Tax=Alteromonas halophila TaxID=516698 RepID=A0A918JD45_9ALTE|nr:GGDEF domain-containing protein [Alteromonas halophila]GGW75027.1 GGDEF domain-containing protein [Alteromonas halophila]
MSKLKRLFLTFINRGTHPQLDEDVNRRIMVVNLFSVVGVTITCLLGIRALTEASWILAALLLLSTLLFASAHIVQQTMKNQTGRLISMIVLLGCLMLLMAFLLVTGGVANTGPLWIYTVPPVTLFFAGFKRGLMIVCAFILLMVFILFSPHDALLLTVYSPEFKTRLLLSFMTITFLSAFYECSRETTYVRAVSLREEFEQQALHDQLTQLPNRRGAYAHIDQESRRIQRNGRPFSLVLADIDHFKSINDQFGHSVGDIILQRVARLFVDRLRAQDVVARWGGEEFLFILPDTPQASAAFVAEHLRTALEAQPIVINGHTHNVSASFGVCEFNQDAKLDRVLSLADTALYQAKRAGRNKVTTSSDLSD